jgi:hypothetical protein
MMIPMMIKSGESMMSPHNETMISTVRFAIRSQALIETEVISMTGISPKNVSLLRKCSLPGRSFG